MTEFKIDIKPEYCDYSLFPQSQEHYNWKDLSVLILSFISILFGYKYIYEYNYIYRIYRESKRRSAKEISSLELAYELIDDLNQEYIAKKGRNSFITLHKNEFERKKSSISIDEMSDQILAKKIAKHPGKYINIWNIICLIGNIIQCVGSAISLINSRFALRYITALKAVGCFFAWISMINYFQFSKNFSFLFSTLFSSLPAAIKYITGLIPIFFGFGLLASSIFSDSYRFSSLSTSLFTQFSLINSDNLFSTYDDISKMHFWLAIFYLFTLILFFVIAFQNLLVTLFHNFFKEIQKKSEKNLKKSFAFQSNAQSFVNDKSKFIENILNSKNDVFSIDYFKDRQDEKRIC